MKTLSKILAVFAALCALASCRGIEGPVGPMGPRGPQGPEGPAGQGANWEVIEFDVPSDAWNYSQEMGDIEHGYLSTTLDCPEITEDIYKIGLVLVYVVAPKFQSVLPYERYYYGYEKDDQGKDIPDRPIFWASTIASEIRPGAVDIYFTNSDFFLADDDFADYKFRVVIMW